MATRATAAASLAPARDNRKAVWLKASPAARPGTVSESAGFGPTEGFTFGRAEGGPRARRSPRIGGDPVGPASSPRFAFAPSVAAEPAPRRGGLRMELLRQSRGAGPSVRRRTHNDVVRGTRAGAWKRPRAIGPVLGRSGLPVGSRAARVVIPEAWAPTRCGIARSYAGRKLEPKIVRRTVIPTP